MRFNAGKQTRPGCYAQQFSVRPAGRVSELLFNTVSTAKGHLRLDAVEKSLGVLTLLVQQIRAGYENVSNVS